MLGLYLAYCYHMIKECPVWAGLFAASQKTGQVRHDVWCTNKYIKGVNRLHIYLADGRCSFHIRSGFILMPLLPYAASGLFSQNTTKNDHLVDQIRYRLPVELKLLNICAAPKQKQTGCSVVYAVIDEGLAAWAWYYRSSHAPGLDGISMNHE